MNTNTPRDAASPTSSVWARRAAALSVAGLLTGLALAPTSAFADHPASRTGDTTTHVSDRWSYMYDAAQRREAMARVQDSNEAQASSSDDGLATTRANPWSYMYVVPKPHVVRHRVAPAKVRHDYIQRKAHPALAHIMVSVSASDPATCYLPDTVDPATRRLIAVQLCGKAQIVPAVFLARAAVYEPGLAYSLGHL